MLSRSVSPVPASLLLAVADAAAAVVASVGVAVPAGVAFPFDGAPQRVFPGGADRVVARGERFGCHPGHPIVR